MVKYIQNIISRFMFKNAVLEGKDLKGIRLRKQCLFGKDLSKADMQKCTARKVDFSEADMRGICMKDSDLRSSDFSGADLSGADLRRTDLRGAKFDNAVMENVRLGESDIRGTSFMGAFMRGADLDYMLVNKDTNFEGADMDNASGYLRSSRMQTWAEAGFFSLAVLLSSVAAFVGEGASILVYVFIGISSVILTASILAVELGEKEIAKRNKLLSGKEEKKYHKNRH